MGFVEKAVYQGVVTPRRIDNRIKFI